jgi:hypothetical protein
VFENRLLVGLCGLKRRGVIRVSRKLHKEDLSNLFCFPRIIRMNKSRRLKWEEQVACMVRRRMHIGISWELQREIDMSEDNIPTGLIYCNMAQCRLD